MIQGNSEKGLSGEALDAYLRELDRELGEDLPKGGLDLKPGPLDDAFTRELMEQERAYMNPEEWGIYLEPILLKKLNPPADPKTLSPRELARLLHDMIDLFCQYHLCIVQTNHLSDEEFYLDILNNIIKKPIGIGGNPIGAMIYHECCASDDLQLYLKYFATDLDREMLAREFDEPLPEKAPLKSSRDSWIENLAEKYRFKPLPE